MTGRPPDLLKLVNAVWRHRPYGTLYVDPAGCPNAKLFKLLDLQWPLARSARFFELKEGQIRWWRHVSGGASTKIHLGSGVETGTPSNCQSRVPNPASSPRVPPEASTAKAFQLSRRPSFADQLRQPRPPKASGMRHHGIMDQSFSDSHSYWACLQALRLSEVGSKAAFQESFAVS